MPLAVRQVYGEHTLVKSKRVPSDKVLGLLAKILNLDSDLVMVTAYFERADTQAAKAFFCKIHSTLTQPNTEIQLASLTKAQMGVIVALYNHWQDPNHLLRAETIKRPTNPARRKGSHCYGDHQSL